MITLSDAQQLIAHHAVPRSSVTISLEHAAFMTLAHDLAAPVDLPSFDNSAVDGFAICTTDSDLQPRLALSPPIRAQGQHAAALAPGSARKIMTGAPVPRGANAVVMLEDTSLAGDVVLLHKSPKPGDNIRVRGEDVPACALIAQKGTTLSPQLIGLLAGLGFVGVTVFRPPSIKVISTGDELQTPGKPLQFGEVYYLMGPMLKAQAALCGVRDLSYEVVADDVHAIHDAIERAFDADIILLTGGMSKGDYDYGRAALSAHRCEEIFYQGAWRPGKPLYFGKKDRSLIFGLPGNPVAAFVCFHVFVHDAIRRMREQGAPSLKTAIAVDNFAKKPGFTFFARAVVDDARRAHFLSGQGSHQIFHLSRANALCLVPQDKAIVKSGEVVHYYELA